jgi:DNA polymerase-3 subunit gamma/tau
MFATTEPEKVLPTILSRCQRFDLRRIPAALIVKHLEEIARLEKVTVEPAALYAMARGAEGGMRDAESALDQLISFCGSKIEEADVLSMFGLTAQKQLLDLSGAVLAGEVEGALRQLNDLAGHGKDLGRLLADLLNHFRNLLIFQVSRGDMKLLEVTEAQAAALAEQAKLASTEGLTRILEVFGDADLRLRDTTSKKILVEVALLKAIEARDAVSLDTVLKRLGELRAQSGAGQMLSPPTPAPAPAPERRLQPAGGGQMLSPPTPAPAPAPGPRPVRAETVAEIPRAVAPYPPASGLAPMLSDAPAEAGVQNPNPNLNLNPNLSLSGTPAGAGAQNVPPARAPAGDLTQLWASLLEGVGRASQFTRTYLLEAHPISFDKNLFTIGFGPEFEGHIGLTDTARTHSLLQTKLAELGHPNVQFKFIKAEAPPNPAPQPAPRASAAQAPVKPAAPPAAAAAPAKDKSASAPASQEDFKNDPLIRKALEIFKGQIVEVGA